MAYNLALKDLEKHKSGIQKMKLDCHLPFFRNLRDNPPQPDITEAGAGTLTTRDEVTSLMRPGFAQLSQTQRIIQWTRLFQKDDLSTFFESSRDIVDVR